MNLASRTVDEKGSDVMNPTVMQKLSYGLFVLTARDGDKDNGCIVNTVTQVANEPNTISISVNKSNYTHDMIMKTGKFNVSSAERRWQVVNNPLDTFILKYLFSTSLRPFHVFIHTL